MQSDSFVYQSANFGPRIKILLFLSYVENCSKLFIKVSWKLRNWKNKSAHQIDVHHPHIKYGFHTTFLSITFHILILEYRYCYFLILQRLGYWKMYRNTFEDVFETEKEAKQKWVLFFETPCSYTSSDSTNGFLVKFWPIFWCSSFL